MTRSYNVPPQAAVDTKKPLTRAEKLRKIRELIRQRILPVWADPYFPHWTPPKTHGPEVLDSRQKRQKELKEFREWYIARDRGKYAAIRQANRERQEVHEQLHYDEMEMPFRRDELRDVLRKDSYEERSAYDAYLKTLPSELDVMRAKTKLLTDIYNAEERNFVQKQYERQWKSCTGAEELRVLDAQAHKLQSVRDLNEILFFTLLDDFEDYEVDAYYVKLGLDRVAQERRVLDEDARKHKEFEVRGQTAVLEQMREHALAKEKIKKAKEGELKERLHFEERLRFDDFKEAYEDQERMRERAEELMGQKQSNYMGIQENLRLKKEAADAEAWAKQMKEEAEAEEKAIAKAKAIEYRRHLDQDRYNMAIVAASHNDAVEQYAKQYLKEQQIDALYNLLDYQKKKQGLQSRIDKELQSQVDARKAEKQAEIAEKQVEQRQMDTEKELARIRDLEAAAEKKACQQRTAQTLKRQMSEKEECNRQDKAANTAWAENFEKQRAIEDAYIRHLGGSGKPAKLG